MKTSVVSTKLAVFVVFSLFSLMVIPAYANVTSVNLEKSFYTDDENIVFSGVIKSTERQSVFVIIRDSNDRYQTMVSAPISNTDGTFSTIPREVDGIFKSKDTYYATAFTDEQKEKDGIILKLEYDGDKVFLVPDFVLSLKSISDKTIEVEKTITFTASVTDSSIDNVSFSLDNEPSGATIDSKSGKFVWTPSKSHGNIQDVYYSFDIIATKGIQEDKERITITVKQAYVEPKKISEPIKEPEPTKTTQPKELGVASFVDETKDPQSYVDRYDNEATYKKWFDDNFAEYDSIYQAVGLEVLLLIPASFVDETKDPQSYVDRYTNEATYKKWFDDNFAEYDSIYQAVGLEEPKVEEKKFGICGPGTKLIDGVCTIVEMPVVKPWWKFW